MIRSTSSIVIRVAFANSSGVGSRPVTCRICSASDFNAEMLWNMCTGIRIVRAWSATARVIAWRIHHVAYVENLYPRRYSYFSTPRINPALPSWIRSRKLNPRLRYFLAIETTNRRLPLDSCCFASVQSLNRRIISSTRTTNSSNGSIVISCSSSSSRWHNWRSDALPRPVSCPICCLSPVILSTSCCIRFCNG